MFCLTDVYSSRIVGHCFSTRMRSEEARIALNQWVALRGEEHIRNCIHHTDGGGQYFSSDNLKLLHELGVRVSAAKNCLQNGYAEQRNGLFKHHLLPTIKAAQPKNIGNEVKRCIEFFNLERMQEGLRWKSPVDYENYLRAIDARPIMILYDHDQHSN